MKSPNQSVTEYIIRASINAFTALKNAGETVTNSFLIAIVLKGSPEIFKKPLAVVITQSKRKRSVSKVEATPRSVEDAER